MRDVPVVIEVQRRNGIVHAFPYPNRAVAGVELTRILTGGVMDFTLDGEPVSIPREDIRMASIKPDLR